MNNTDKVGNFKILSDLGEGYTGMVRLGRCLRTGKRVALKMCEVTHILNNDEVLQGLQDEARILSQLDHPNIAKFIEYSPEAEAIVNGNPKIVSYLALELAAKGDMFDFINVVQGLGEAVTRRVFKQFLSALHYLHERNIAHRDIKLENILFDENLQVKLVDFGFAAHLDPVKLNKTYVGTENYMSPEQLCQQPYNGKKIDVFAAGMILFAIRRGRPPFNSAMMLDSTFKLFFQRRHQFWMSHQNVFPNDELTPPFMELINGMLDPNPTTRWSLDRVLNSAWINQPFDDKQALEKLSFLYQIYQQKKSEEVNKAQPPRENPAQAGAIEAAAEQKNQPEPAQTDLQLPLHIESVDLSGRSRIKLPRKTKQIKKKKRRAFRRLKPSMKNLKYIRRTRKKGNG